jgi:hypothetical protein
MGVYEDHPEILDPAFVADFDFMDCWTFLNDHGAFEVRDVAIALLRAEGNIKSAAKFLGRSRRATEVFISRTLALKELHEDIDESFIDDIEEAYKKDAMTGDPVARKFFLMTKGRNRGFVTRNESTGKDGGPIEVDAVDARSVLAARIDGVIERRTAAQLAAVPDTVGSGANPLELADMGEVGATSTD